MDGGDQNTYVVKKIIHNGSKCIDFNNGTKVTFHFQTRLKDEEQTILDDSRKLGSGTPMELVLGKKFKLEVWEVIVQKMALNEVAEFTVHKSLVTQYPFVSKTLRDAAKPNTKRRTHCCAATLQNEGVGYSDLNDLLKTPSDLIFVIELLKIEQPDEYKKESWQMNEDEKLKMIPVLREKGNDEYRNKNYDAAAKEYSQAIGMLEQLMLKEKPREEEWLALEKQKMPLLLNFSQCKLNQGEYHSVIEHCTTVLNNDPNNVKALYRRAKAHVGAWNPHEAQKDFEKVMELDETLQVIVQRELKILNDLKKNRDQEDKNKFKNLF